MFFIELIGELRCFERLVAFQIGITHFYSAFNFCAYWKLNTNTILKNSWNFHNSIYCFSIQYIFRHIQTYSDGNLLRLQNQIFLSCAISKSFSLFGCLLMHNLSLLTAFKMENRTRLGVSSDSFLMNLCFFLNKSLYTFEYNARPGSSSSGVLMLHMDSFNDDDSSCASIDCRVAKFNWLMLTTLARFSNEMGIFSTYKRSVKQHQ